jgi:RNA-binding protein
VSGLRGSDRRYLRSLGSALRPVVTVGRNGVSDALLAKLRAELDAHELIKVRLTGEDRAERDALSVQLAEASASECVGRIGGVALLFRAHPDPERRRIALPGRASRSAP